MINEIKNLSSWFFIKPQYDFFGFEARREGNLKN